MSENFHKLSSKWTISEKYTAAQSVDYKKTIADVCSFSTVEELAFLMKETIYANLTQLFGEPLKTKQFKHFIDGNDTQIEAIQFFKNDIKPLWEDPENEKGGDLQFEIAIQHYDQYDALYKDILYEAIGQSKEEYLHINGVRFLDKINGKANHGIRVELWLDIDPHSKNENIHKLDQWILAIAQKYELSQLKIKFQTHKPK